MAYQPFQFARGQGRGRGGSRGGYRGRPVFPSASPTLPAPNPSQKQLKVIIATHLGEDSYQTQAHKIENVQYVASYNWIDENVSTILVPGQPPKWLPPAGKQQLREDSGSYYRDRNAANHPQYPIEPAIQATYELNPDFEASQIDLFGCGSTIGSLLAFVSDEERTFRFGVERVGSTVFLVRKTNTPREVIDDVRGYGHSFPEAYTVWEPEVKGSSSYQRIIRYDFAGLKCMIRSESDGYLPNKPSSADPATKKPHNVKHEPGSDSLRSFELGGGAPLTTAMSIFSQAHALDTASKKLTIKRAGKPIDQRAIFDLKTRSVRRKDAINLSEFLPRLWVNQTSKFILAWHIMGVFDEIEIKNVRNDVVQWEQANQQKLAKLHKAFKALIQFSSKHARFEVRRTELGPLEIWSEVEGWTALPPKLKTRWCDGFTEFGDETEDAEGVVVKAEDKEDKVTT